MRRAALVALGLAVGLPLYLGAQAPDSLSPGKRIRLQTESSSSWIIGTVIAVDLDSVHLLLAETTHDVSIKRGAITQLEVSDTVKSSSGRKAGQGFLIGAAIGALAGLASGDDQSGFIRFTAGEKAGMLGILGGGFGALLGALAGSSVHERWSALPVTEVRAMLTPRGAGLALSVAF
ncbi:MAG TPA: hypothetical protein VKQ05_00480 [Gemmatimonadales bacterium]|nr:hypothetical protein [Gemmatimonadales bacterium]